MSLKNVTLFTIIGLAYIFIFRTIATIFPEIFISRLIIRINSVVTLIAIITPALFFYYFYNDYIPPEQTKFRKITFYALLGSLLIIILHLKSILKVFGIKIIFAPLVDIVFSLISSLLFLYFFIYFSKHLSGKKQYHLKFSTSLVIIGTVLIIVMRFMILFNYFYLGKFGWIWNYTRVMPFIVLPVVTFAFFSRFNFLLVFYKRQ